MKYRKHFNSLFAMLLLTVFSLHVQAQDIAEKLSNYSLGIEAYKEGDFRHAFDAWSLGAYEGNAEAQYNLGVLYLEGRGVEPNVDQAREWFLKAAEKNHLEAQYNLGHMSLSGMSVEKNIQDALLWWKLAAEGGYAQAQFNYGRAMYLGVGGYDDKDGGLALIRLAAEQKDARAVGFLNKNTDEIERLKTAKIEPTAAKKVVGADTSIPDDGPNVDILSDYQPGKIKLRIVREQHPVQKDYLMRSADVPVTVYTGADFSVPIGRIEPGTLLKVTGMETTKIRVLPVAGLPAAWAKRDRLNLRAIYPSVKQSNTTIFTQPGGDEIGVLPVGVRIDVLEKNSDWVKLRVSTPGYGWIAASNLTYSGESAQQLKDAWQAELQAQQAPEKEPAEAAPNAAPVLAEKKVVPVLAKKKTAPAQREISASSPTAQNKPMAASKQPQISALEVESQAQSNVAINDNAWLFTQDKGAHVIHMFTLLDFNKATRIAAQARYRDRAHLYTTRIKQKQWTFLLLGPYADERAATTARLALPPQFANHAQVRKLSLLAKKRCAKRESLNQGQSKGLDAFCF